MTLSLHGYILKTSVLIEDIYSILNYLRRASHPEIRFSEGIHVKYTGGHVQLNWTISLQNLDRFLYSVFRALKKSVFRV